ncbi:MAG: Na+/H+ antiporter NhaA, partial [Alistipes sp.]|nr:Na+/H+ antiporter NhaA [Alistipes sp.]
LEIKREIIAGELSSLKHAALPVAAAVGGMVVPAAIYATLNAGTEFSSGWGIPMATDIAFAIGILSLLGKRVPISLKIFLTALAIMDDLGAILVIAIFYTSSIDFVMLGIGLAVLGLMFWMNFRGIKPSLLYLIPGITVWFFFLNSGVHSTIAGVLAAMAIPTAPRFSKKYFLYKTKYFLEEFRHTDKPGVQVISNPDQMEVLSKVNFVTNATTSPSQKLEHILNPWVTFLIMPVFAFANAGVELHSLNDLRVLNTTQGLGIFLGLVLGKPLGIFLFCWLTIKAKWAVLPANSTWNTLLGVACLGGIGFTMSIFIDNLAFAGTPWVDTGKIAVLVASVSAAVFGALVINFMVKKDKIH